MDVNKYPLTSKCSVPVYAILFQIYLTNRFQVAVRLFSNRSKVAHEALRQLGIYLFYIIKN